MQVHLLKIKMLNTLFQIGFLQLFVGICQGLSPIIQQAQLSSCNPMLDKSELDSYMQDAILEAKKLTNQEINETEEVKSCGDFLFSEELMVKAEKN